MCGNVQAVQQGVSSKEMKTKICKDGDDSDETEMCKSRENANKQVDPTEAWV